MLLNRRRSFSGPFMSSFMKSQEEENQEDEKTVRYGSWSEYIIPSFLRRNSTSSSNMEIRYDDTTVITEEKKEKRRSKSADSDMFWLVLSDTDPK